MINVRISELGESTTGYSVECYRVCNFVVLFSAVEVCVDCGDVYVFQVCFSLCVVYGVRIYVDVCGVVWAVMSCSPRYRLSPINFDIYITQGLYNFSYPSSPTIAQ